jgi:hypothetical protein
VFADLSQDEKKNWSKALKLLYKKFWTTNILQTPGYTVCFKKQTRATQRKEIREEI